MYTTNFEIQSYWGKLFTLHYWHHYFSDRVCRDFSIEPTEATKDLMRNFRMVFKPVKDGVVVLYDKAKTDMLLRITNPTPEKLTFIVRHTNPRFINFTEIPFTPIETLFYFNNLKKNVSSLQEKLLHPQAFVAAAPETQVQRVTRVFEYTFDTPVAYQDITITDATGKEIVKKELGEGQESIKKTTHTIHLGGMPFGCFTIKAKGAKNVLQCYTTDFAFDKCFGVIDIYLNDAPDTANRLVDGKGGMTSPDYYIQYNARVTYWRYYIVENDNVQYNAHQVLDKDKKIEFGSSAAVTLNNGRTATLITSKTPIPLKQYPVSKFELNMKRNGKGTTATVNLPLANVEVIKPDMREGKVYSDIYVHL